MATVRTRIPLPNTKDQIGALTLAATIYEKHVTDGANSVIRGQLKTDFEALGPELASGIDYHKRAVELEKQLEDAYEKRDNVANRARPIVQRISKALQSEYGHGNLRQMGAHGFTVNDTPHSPKSPKA